MTGLTERVIDLCDRVSERGGPLAQKRIDAIRGGLTEPLRIAFAGRVSSGKSTLVNACLGQRIAPTASGECTRVVTHFRHSYEEKAELVLKDGSRRLIQLDPHDRCLPGDPGHPASEIERIEVTLPNKVLEGLAIVDTPGLAALSSHGAPSEALLGMDADSRAATTKADALVYVMSTTAMDDDRQALEEFRRHFSGLGGSAVNTIAVLNKVDLMRTREGDGMLEGSRIAGRLAAELKSVAQTVIPLSGLLAEASRADSFRMGDWTNLMALARMEPVDRDLMLMSRDEFLRNAPLSHDAKLQLYELLGLYGVKRALQRIDAGVTSWRELQIELSEMSGIDVLRDHIGSLLGKGRDALKADWALSALERLAYSGDSDEPDFRWLLADLEKVRDSAEMHRLGEMWALRQCASRAVELSAEFEAELVLLATNDSVARRLGQDEGAGSARMKTVALEGANRWLRMQHDPRSPKQTRLVAEVAYRSYNLMWQEIDQGERAELP